MALRPLLWLTWQMCGDKPWLSAGDQDLCHGPPAEHGEVAGRGASLYIHQHRPGACWGKCDLKKPNEMTKEIVVPVEHVGVVPEYLIAGFAQAQIIDVKPTSRLGEWMVLSHTASHHSLFSASPRGWLGPASSGMLSSCLSCLLWPASGSPVVCPTSLFLGSGLRCISR